MARGSGSSYGNEDAGGRSAGNSSYGNSNAGGRSSGGRSSGSASNNDGGYFSQGGPAGNSAGMGGLGGGYDGPSFAGSGSDFADAGSSYGRDGAGDHSSTSAPSGRAPSGPGNDGYYGGTSPVGIAAGQGGLGGAVSGNRTDYFGGGIGSAIGNGLGSRSTYGQSLAGGIAVSSPVGQVGRGLNVSDGYRQMGRSLAEAGVRNLSAPGRNLSSVERARIGATTSMPMEMAALLAAVAIPESAKDWAAKFRDRVTDFTRHPGNAKTITRGHTKGLSSSAAGAFQFIQDTYRSLANRLGLTDFSPRSQTIAAVSLAKELYANHGRNHESLEAALEARDFDDIKEALGKTNSRGHSIGWEGITIQSADRLSRNFENELAGLKADTDIRTDATIDEAGQVFTNLDGSTVATPARATFETKAGKGTDQFTNQVYGYLTADLTPAAIPAATDPTVPTSSVPAVAQDGLIPEHAPPTLGRPETPGLWTNPFPGVDLEDRPGSVYTGANEGPAEDTFERDYLQPAQPTTTAAPPNTPMPVQQEDTTVRDVVPADWNRPERDPWEGLRVAEGNDGQPQDPWQGLRGQQVEAVRSLGGRLLAGTIDTGLALIPSFGIVNLGVRLTSGKTLGEHLVDGDLDTVEDWQNQISGSDTSDVAISASPSPDPELDEEADDDPVDDFAANYLGGQSNPSPSLRWGRRAA